jgi:hypothetical protein
MWNPVRGLAQLLRKTRLKVGPVSNNLQLCTSKHLGDYQWLCTGVVVLMVVGLILLAPGQTPAAGQAPATGPASDASKSLDGTIAVALIGTAVTLFNWIYQAANRRLGVVDLFANEIAVICKVCLVTDFARKSITRRDAVHQANKQTPSSFDTKESYTPIYDKSADDLQTLDSNVVAAVTQFYTYRKTMIDSLHSAMAQTEAAIAVPQYDQMIYMQFLMYECARTTVQELIEFEPDQAENLVTVLCSELPLITFLIKRHRNDPNTVFLYQRLRLRIEGYMKDVGKLLGQIDEVDRSGSESLKKGWSKAITTGKELKIRFEEFERETHSEWEQCQAEKAVRQLDVPDSRQPPLPQAA